ncbi:ribbon-helix-helix domain-containing protein [Ruminococcaceae bacterium OttesenSCG-928-L11]|nr:ribbon-helix-helix domain-containing protein [Ruminococcaceae bacterium OttesenSCG-928-L11]
MTEQKRITVAIPPDMEQRLKNVKKETFYNCTQSDMIRALIEAGLDQMSETRNGTD